MIDWISLCEVIRGHPDTASLSKQNIISSLVVTGTGNIVLQDLTGQKILQICFLKGTIKWETDRDIYFPDKE